MFGLLIYFLCYNLGMDNYDETNHGDSLNVCPECCSSMKESEKDPSMLVCDKCGYSMSNDEARTLDEETSE